MNIDQLPSSIFSSQQVRDIDYSAINKHGIDGFELMTKAAQFSFETLRSSFVNSDTIVTLCGSGNNGGDGYIVSGLAIKAGLASSVYFLSPPEKLTGDAQRAYQFAKQSGVEIKPYTETVDFSSFSDNSVIVDALLGTGLNSEVKGLYYDAINNANNSNLPILAIDIPSGLCANTGRVFGASIKAHITATFIGMKIGLMTGQGRHHCGRICFDQLDVPVSIIEEQIPVAKLINLKHELNQLAQREKHAHKGSFGHTLIIGGEEGYGGAALLASETALQAGSGLTSLITHDRHVAACLARLPEVMVNSHLNLKKSLQLIEQASVIVIGPGLGKSTWSERMLQEVLALNKPIVLDADALNLIAQKPKWIDKTNQFGDLRIITPHPGEAARLLKCDTSEIQSDRLSAVRTLAKKFNCNAMLKGSGSLTSSNSSQTYLCAYGNPGMAVGGMGDVLAGLIGSLIAQGFTPERALPFSVALHSYAADILSEQNGEIGMAASELPGIIRMLLNKKLAY